MPAAILLCLEETLPLILGVPIRWSASDTVRGDLGRTELLPLPKPVRPRLGPPLRWDSPEALSSLATLQSRYLAFLVETAPSDPEQRHPLAVNILRILNASAIEVASEALYLGVQTESILRTYFADQGQQTQAFTDAVDELVEYIGLHQSQDSHLVSRAQNMINGMKGQNPRTALNALVSAGTLATAHVQAWNAVRHQAAHGIETSSPTPVLVGHCNMVHQLVLLLVCRLIGFSSHLTDYTRLGWPTLSVADIVTGHQPEPLG